MGHSVAFVFAVDDPAPLRENADVRQAIDIDGFEWDNELIEERSKMVVGTITGHRPRGARL